MFFITAARVLHVSLTNVKTEKLTVSSLSIYTVVGSDHVDFLTAHEKIALSLYVSGTISGGKETKCNGLRLYSAQ